MLSQQGLCGRSSQPEQAQTLALGDQQDTSLSPRRYWPLHGIVTHSSCIDLRSPLSFQNTQQRTDQAPSLPFCPISGYRITENTHGITITQNRRKNDTAKRLAAHRRPG